MNKGIKFILTIMAVYIFTCCSDKKQELLILCTNDSHSQVEAKDGKGGFAARADVVDSLRKVYPLNILLDAGDMMQGTPYFNIYHGRIRCRNTRQPRVRLRPGYSGYVSEISLFPNSVV